MYGYGLIPSPLLTIFTVVTRNRYGPYYVRLDTLQGRRIAKKLVSERFRSEAEPRCNMLGSFIRHGLREEEGAGEALLQIVAGSDPSAGTIRGVMLNVLTNTHVY